MDGCFSERLLFLVEIEVWNWADKRINKNGYHSRFSERKTPTEIPSE